MRRLLLLGVVLAALLDAAIGDGAAAQWPGEIVGTIVDGETQRMVPFATVEVAELGLITTAGSDGGFRFKAVSSGTHVIRAQRLGYRPSEVEVEVAHGRTTRVAVELAVAAVRVDPVVAYHPDRDAGGFRIDRATIERSGAVTVGDLVDRVPGVVVRRTGLTGPEYAMIRGSGAEGVLVLLDGVAINDPVTGAADLSTLSASTVESVKVEVGARSARYGSRARAGVIVVESRPPGTATEIVLGVGSLGSRSGSIETGNTIGAWRWSAGGLMSSSDGGFDYRLPVSAGGRSGTRTNADLSRINVFATAERDFGGGRLGFRTAVETGDRGLPGKAFAPSINARQVFDRVRLHASWNGVSDDGSSELAFHGARQRLEHRDPEPPLGLAYDDETAVDELGLRSSITRAVHQGGLREIGFEGDFRHRAVDADGLTEGAFDDFNDFGVGARAVGDLGDLDLTAQVRLDLDDVTDAWFVSHTLGLGLSTERLRFDIAHRSAFNPPALGDLFFDAAIGIAPNPELRPERVVSEIEFGVSAHRLGEIALAAGGSVYRADVDDMIEWAPDFRFIWSPQNFDVQRRGGEVWLSATITGMNLMADLSYSNARVRYDSSEGRADVQVVYRPQHSAHSRVEWTPGDWRLRAESRYTGARTTAPTEANQLPGFWTFDVAAAWLWRVGSLAAETEVAIDRVGGETQALIFGFPEPGRRFRVQLRIRPQNDDRGL
jgi:outer membrane cobalamin receptor